MRKINLDILVDLRQGILDGYAYIELKKPAKYFILNKGLEVKYCNMEFSQKIVELTDFEKRKVNFIKLEKPAENVEVKYSGTLGSHEDVFPYLKDKINEEYTLLRTDTYFYPIFARPTSKDIINIIVKSNFDAEIIVSGIPSGYSVAFGGEIRGNNLRISNTWRLDIAIAKFSLVSHKNFRIFVLKRNEKYARKTLKLIWDAFKFCCKMFGEKSVRYTVIEIPDGYGGQAGIGYSLVESKWFKSSIPYGIYHELAHFWNPKAEGEVQRTRFFDEAFANYITALIVKELYGEDEFKNALEKFRKTFWQLVEKYPKGKDIPLVEYGKYELGIFSYTKGALILYELHKLLGEKFYDLIRESCRRFGNKPIDFKSFEVLAEEISGKSLNKFFNEKIYGIWNPSR